jgi:hypothetical protein
MRLYLGAAKNEEVTEEEMGAAQSIVMAVAAGRINVQLREIRENDEHTGVTNPPAHC